MVKSMVTVLAVLGGVGALVASAVDTGPLPDLKPLNCAWDLWPEVDLEKIEVGGHDWQAYEAVGRHNARPPLLDTIEPHRCVAFVYDQKYLPGPPLSLTVRLDNGMIGGRWLTRDPFDRGECQGLPRELISLRGYYHAAACWESRWQ